MTQVSNEKTMRADRLSDLPDDLILRILSLLNIKYAVQTCVLSKRWTGLWTRVHTLNFNTDIFESFGSFENFLCLLSFRYDASKLYSCSFSAIDDGWDDELVGAVIDYAISNGVKDLSLHCPMDENERFGMPFQVFTCQSLKRLVLVDVSIPQLPSSISSDFLTNLQLHDVRIEIDHELLLSCTNLENFVMDDCIMFSQIKLVISCPKLMNLMISYSIIDGTSTRGKIKISAPRLVSFEISAAFDYNLIISLDRCPALESVKIYLSKDGDMIVDDLLQRRTYVMHLIDFMKELNDIKYLTLSTDFIEILSEFPDLMKNLPSPFHNLKALKLTAFWSRLHVVIPPEVRSFLFDGPQMILKL